MLNSILFQPQVKFSASQYKWVMLRGPAVALYRDFIESPSLETFRAAIGDPEGKRSRAHIQGYFISWAEGHPEVEKQTKINGSGKIYQRTIEVKIED